MIEWGRRRRHGFRKLRLILDSAPHRGAAGVPKRTVEEDDVLDFPGSRNCTGGAEFVANSRTSPVGSDAIDSGAHWQGRITLASGFRVVTLRDYWPMLKHSLKAWNDDYASSMGAALAYYTTFSLAPLLIIVIAVAGLVFGEDAARGLHVGLRTQPRIEVRRNAPADVARA